MLRQKKIKSKETSSLHPRNQHRDRYDFVALTHTMPELAQYVIRNKSAYDTIDFFDPEAVKALNKALLLHHYGLSYWDIPDRYLCPSIPGRADYIHYMADVLASFNHNVVPMGKKIIGLDIGIGANAVYPILAIKEYNWNFIGSEVHLPSLEAAQLIADRNPSLQGKLTIRRQYNINKIFEGIILKDEFIDLVVCNPPFHHDSKEAHQATMRKLKNLSPDNEPLPVLNFGGKDNELWRSGGELQFAYDMIRESQAFATSCFLFSIMLSKKISIEPIIKALKKTEATEIKEITMTNGQKISRIIIWSFLNEKQQEMWSKSKK